jgi:plasmid stabilization system protein ParE
MKLVFKKRALRHVEAIHRRIAENDIQAASRTIVRIQKSIKRLENYPLSGRSGGGERDKASGRS